MIYTTAELAQRWHRDYCAARAESLRCMGKRDALIRVLHTTDPAVYGYVTIAERVGCSVETVMSILHDDPALQ